MTSAAIGERDRLERAEEAVERWMQVLHQQADTLDEHQVGSFVDTARRTVARLGRDLGPLDIDPPALAEIQRIVIDAIALLEEQPQMAPLDVLDDLLQRGERIRHVLRDALDEDLGVDPADAGALSRALVGWLARVSQREIAALVGISARQLQRWLKDGGQAPRRLALVAHLVVLLRRAWTPEGVLAWFARGRRDLEGHAPLDLLDDPGWEQALLEAARQGRAQHGG